MGIIFNKLTTKEALDKIKEVLEDSDMIKIHNARYWDFWKLIELTEKEIKGRTLYTIVVDYGKPYEIKVSTEEQLRKELKHLKEIHASGEYPHFDIWIYDENNKDVTSEILKKYPLV